ncbi:MAG: EAL domain-containing protein, partial [Oscillibacter sp.]
GSGYSSLNTLRDIAVDILKIDMKFLPAGTTDGRSERILTSVIRMAGWLGIPVVVEGVETAQQRDFLKSVGCGYIQGYFYARPMPVAEYETLMQTDEQAEPPLPITQESEAVLENLWRADFQRDMILRHISQPVLICEVLGEETEVLRVNQAYLAWMSRCDEIVSLRQLCRQYISPEFWPVLRQTLSAVVREESVRTVDYRRTVADGTLWLRAQVQYLHELPSSHLIFVSLSDITREKTLEAELKALRS